MDPEYFNEEIPTITEYKSTISVDQQTEHSYLELNVANTLFERKLARTTRSSWSETFSKTSKETIIGEHASGKLYKRTAITTIENLSSGNTEVIERTEWATIDDIVAAKIGNVDNGC